jgi:uncharacterized damage-inducible protein DinB
MLRAILAAAAVPLIVSSAAAQSISATAEARTLWKSFIGNVTQAADELPESLYAYRPTPDVRTMGQLFAHIAGAQKGYCALALGEKAADERDVEMAATTKAAIVAVLKESNTYCERAYAQSDAQVKVSADIFGQQRSRYYALIANAAHDAEHYGNIVTYMRLNKLVPPSSRPKAGQ